MTYAKKLLLISGLLLPLLAAAQERVFVQVPAVISPAASIRAATREQCNVEKKLGEYTVQAIAKRNPSVQAVASAQEAGNDTFILLTVIGIDGYGGGGWSGPKIVSIRAEAFKGGALAGTSMMRRSSKGGVFGAFMGTCSIIDHDLEVLGKDVAKWVARGAPTSTANTGPAAAEEVAEPAPAPAK